MKEIGGYFELETNDFGTVLHDKAIAVNSGRNALEYILLANSYKKIYIPYYTCDVTIQPLKKLNIDFEFYFLDENFFPKIDKLNKYEALLYVNYFGIMNYVTYSLVKQFKNVIIDNSQAFYAMPLKNVPTFYSPRKFFGVSDGGFAYTNRKIDLQLDTDKSQERISHLIVRIEEGTEAGYGLFKENDAKLNDLPLRKMSKLTKKLLNNINFDIALEKRNSNFKTLHKVLKKDNDLTPIIEKDKINAPLVYPFLKKGNNKLMNYLIQSKIFVARYWPNVREWLNDKESFEYYLFINLIPLPIDQRYNEGDINAIINKMQSFN